MRVWIVHTHTLVSPWNEDASHTRIEDQTLEESWRALVQSVCPKATLEKIPSDDGRLTKPFDQPTLLVYDSVWCSEGLLREFLRTAQKYTEATILALPSTDRMVAFSQALQDLGTVHIEGAAHRIYPVAFIPQNAHISPHDDLALAPPPELNPRTIDLRTKDHKVPVHTVFAPDGALILPFTSRAIVRVSHWMHVLRANQLARLAWGARLVQDEPWRLLWAALHALSINSWKVLAKLVVRGKGCDIHPTAVVEGSVLGDRVKIGAHAVVRFSHLADGAHVGEGSQVISSVLGKGASVSRMAFVQSTVLYPGANTGHLCFQLCVMGTNAFLGADVFLADFKPEGTIQVRSQGALVDSETNLLGCAVGHRCKLFMGVKIYPGREIPNDYTILGPTHDVLSKLPTDLPTDGTPLVGVGGTLQTLRVASDQPNANRDDVP